MGFELRGTPNKVKKVSASLDDCRPDKAKVVKVEKKAKKKEGHSGKAD